MSTAMILAAVAPMAAAASDHPTMSRKPNKGYFVRGQFVAEGSELDLELKRELKGTDAPARPNSSARAPSCRSSAKTC